MAEIIRINKKMENLSPQLMSILGPIGIIFAIFIWRVFDYLKTRKKENGDNNLDKEILNELQTMNQNHLNSLKLCIENGNKELRDTLHQDNVRIIEILGRIDGRLSR